MPFSLRPHWPVIGRWPRWLGVGICLLLAAASAHASPRASTATGRTVAVVVAARALPAGHVLVRADLRVVRWPTGLSPPDAPTDTAGLVGRRLAGAVDIHDALTSRRVLGRGLTAGLPAGTVAAALALPDPGIAAFVHPGDHVDVVAVTSDSTDAAAPTDTAADTGTGPATAEVAATGVLVLAVLPQTDPVDGSGGAELVIATTRANAVRLAGLGARRTFTVVADAP